MYLVRVASLCWSCRRTTENAIVLGEVDAFNFRVRAAYMKWMKPPTRQGLYRLHDELMQLNPAV